MVSGSCRCEPSLVPAFIVVLSKRGGSRSYLEAGARGRLHRQLRRSPKSTTTNATARICRPPLRDRLAAPDRLQPCAPAHPVALAIKEWVDAEALLAQSRPAQAPRLAAAFLPQQREHGVVRSALAAWGQQPEVTDIVLVMVGNVIGQRGQEVGRRVAGYDHLFRPRVLGQEAYLVTIDMLEPMLCDRGTPGIPARVSKKLLLAAEPLDVDIPPTLVLLPQASRELGSSQVGIQDARAIRCSQVRDHGIAPHRHQRLAVKRRLFLPAGAVVLEAALGDENV